MIRRRMYLLALAVLCGVSASPPAAAAGRSSRTRLRVEVYNLAHLSARNITMSTEEAGRLMREVGVDVLWTFPASASPPQTLDIGATAPWSVSGDEEPFIVRILPAAPKDLPYTLGYSIPAQPEWVHAVIFGDHVEQVHYRNRVAYGSLLGYAIAHEITHMLLKTPHHSIRGVMKARWDRADLLDIACGRLHFNPEEEDLITRAALRRLSAGRRSNQLSPAGGG